LSAVSPKRLFHRDHHFRGNQTMTKTQQPAPTIEVELRQFTCIEKRRGKMRESTRPQHWVFIRDAEGAEDEKTWQRVGLVYDRPGAPFNATIPLSEFTPDELDQIKAAIRKHHGQDPSALAGPPANTESDEPGDTDVVIDDEDFVVDLREDDPAVQE